MATMKKRLTREDVAFSITILQDNIEHLDSMLKVEASETNRSRYAASKSAVSPDLAKKLQGRRESLIRTVTWLEKKVAQYDATHAPHPDP